MRLLSLIKAFLLISLSVLPFDRSVFAELGGFECARVGLSAVAEDRASGFSCLEIRQRFSIGGTCMLREYDDGFGWYYSGVAYATAGRLDLVGGALGLDILAGLHYSRLEGGYLFSDFVIGAQFDSDCTFWLERDYIGLSGALGVGNGFTVAWAEIETKPLEKLSFGAGIHYDGELYNWSEPLPFQDTSSWPDRWNGGVNYYLFVGYKIEM
ncbi:hypothetical protein KAH81_00305 [bacterium]|nr:hypothetical protein [bacterium]